LVGVIGADGAGADEVIMDASTAQAGATIKVNNISSRFFMVILPCG
jgi:hypothetical protein